MKSNTALSYLNTFNKLFGISALFLSLSLSLSSLTGQNLPTGIIISANADYAPNGEGQSIDSIFNIILTEFGAIQYEIAYPYANTEDALNCFQITLSDSTKYVDFGYFLDSLSLFDEVLIDSLIYASCQNPVSYNDPGVQGQFGYYIQMANLPCAWELTTGDPSITVAVVDQYFDFSHDDLAGKLLNINLNCKSYLNTVGHGFASAGAVAAIVNNNYCVAGSGYHTTVAGFCVGLDSNHGDPGLGIEEAYKAGSHLSKIN